MMFARLLMYLMQRLFDEAMSWRNSSTASTMYAATYAWP